MTLSNLRKLAIRKQVRIRFTLRNGMECVISEKGIASVPALRQPPDFNLEQELSEAGEFLMDSVASGKAAAKKPEPPRRLQRSELAAMFETSPSAPAAHHDEDE